MLAPAQNQETRQQAVARLAGLLGLVRKNYVLVLTSSFPQQCSNAMRHVVFQQKIYEWVIALHGEL